MREQFHNLQILRGVACLLVVAYHLAGSERGYGLSFSPMRPLLWFGYAGVDLFFVLSGFIIATTCRTDLGRIAKLPRYLFRRAWRSYPTYWAALILAAIFFEATSPEPLIRAEWTAEVTDTLLVLPQPIVPRIVPVAWTLSYELLFYAAFGALFILPRIAAVPVLVGWAGLVVTAAATSTHPGNRFAALAASPFVLEFLAGALIAWCPVRLSRRLAVALLAAAAAWLAGSSTILFDPDPNWLPVTTAPRVLAFGVPAALIVFAMVGWERTAGRLDWPWLKTAGDASYSIYLLHGPSLVLTMYLTMLVKWPHSRLGHTAWLVVMFAGAVGPGLLLYRWVERPLLNLVKRKKAEAAAIPLPTPAAPPAKRAA